MGLYDDMRRTYAEGTIRLGEGGAHGYARGGVRVAPWLIDSVREATRVLPEGYRAEVISTVDPRATGTVWHPSGRAIDIQIYDPQGKKVPNVGDPSVPGWKLYEDMGAAAKVYAVQNYPQEKFVWGGHFNSGTKYDRMHFQSTGDSARNFTPQQIAAANDKLRTATLRPPADVPNVDTAAVPPKATPAAYSSNGVPLPQARPPGAPQVAAAPPAPAGDQPYQPTNAQQQQTVAGITTPPAQAAAATPTPSPAAGTTVAGIPLPQPRPAAPTPGTVAGIPIQAPTPSLGGLGDQISKLFGGGTGGAGYIDPSTGHQIVNPSGSGESGMGLTRDLGPSTIMARGAPAPLQRTGSPAPPAARPAISPAGSVPLPQPRPGNAPDRGPVLDEGPTPPGAITSRPGGLSPFEPTMFDVKQIGQQRPLGDFKPAQTEAAQSRPAWSPFETAPPDVLPAVTQTIQRAPPEAAMLAVPETTPWPVMPQQKADQSRAFSSGGTPMSPYQPTTVSQQLNGQSPFSPAQGQFPSTGLLPFQQWPPVEWGGEGFAGWGGPSFDFG